MRLTAIFATVVITIAIFTLHHSTAQTNANTVVFPSAEVEFIIGPQVKSGTSQLSGASWFDQNAIDRGLALCSAFPDVAHTPGNVLVSGTVSVTKGSKTVTGINTKFTTETSDYAVIGNGPAGRIVKIVGSVQSDTQLTLTLPWEGESLTGQSLSSPSAQEMDNYQGYLNYYDFGFVAYTNYYRTGDSRFLDCARKVTDSWWSQPVIDYGHNLVSLSGSSLAPRSISLNGLMLRALDGHPEMWPWIRDYVKYQFNGWVEVPTGWAEKDPTNAVLYFGVRDGGFMTLYTANLAAVDPDPAIRADLKARVLRGAVNYYAFLQKSDGSYRWNDDSFPFSGSGQPFQIGILNEGLIAVHRLTVDDRVKAAILKSADHEFAKSYSPTGWRAMYYFIHGTIGAGTELRDCEAGCGNAANPFPPADGGLVTEARQLNATLIHLFGYAYWMTGDEKYARAGDEVFDATYSGKDGYRGLAAYRGKEYDESYRAGGHYLAWRAGGGESVPTPSVGPTPVATPSPSPLPTPTPTASPTPTPTPSPSDSPSVDGTKSVTITDNSGGTWTLGLNKETLRNSIHMGGGFGLVYKWLGGIVYVEGTNGAWYRWAGDSWAGAGETEPGVTPVPSPTATPSPDASPTVTPTPTPVPSPTPPICTMTTNSPTIPAWSTGKLVVTLSGVPKSGVVSVTTTSGQVTVTPASQPVALGSAIVEFSLAVKKKSSDVVVSGPCGSQTILVNVK